jgi:hypothetical protein
MEGLTKVWALTAVDDAAHHRYLVQSFIAETRAFQISDAEMAEVSMSGLSNEQTLHCGNLHSALIAQITPTRSIITEFCQTISVSLDVALGFVSWTR